VVSGGVSSCLIALVKRLRWVAPLAAVASLLVACTGTTPAPAASTTATTPVASPSQAQPAAGPLDGLRWQPDAVHVGDLLHDDGTHLWAYGSSGTRRLIWSHPQASVGFIAAAPGGHELALSVELTPSTGSQTSSLLYLLGADGSVKTVDSVAGYETINAPVFLRPPAATPGTLALLWIRLGQNVDKLTERVQSQVMMVGPKGAEPVAIPLRLSEAPIDLHGYPGAGTFTLTLFFTNNVPTRFEVLKNVGYAYAKNPDPWAYFERRADTESGAGVAWVTPTDYVVPVAQLAHPEAYSLRLFRQGCEQYGSEVVYHGTAIDLGYQEQFWPILPAGRFAVLVMTKAALAAKRHHHAAYWSAVDLRTGRLSTTRIQWQQGAWEVVQRPWFVSPTRTPSCAGVHWVWP